SRRPLSAHRTGGYHGTVGPSSYTYGHFRSRVVVPAPPADSGLARELWYSAVGSRAGAQVHSCPLRFQGALPCASLDSCVAPRARRRCPPIRKLHLILRG